MELVVDSLILSEEELAEAEELHRLERIQAFANGLLSKREDAMMAKAQSGVERRWARDLEMYNGTDDVRPTKDNVFGGRPANAVSRRSRVFVHITRQKTDACIAHAFNLLCPTDEPQFDIEATSVPELISAIKEKGATEVIDQQPGPTQGQPLMHPDENRPMVVRDVASDMMREARNRAKGMLTEIRDQLEECDYNAECRQVLTDAAKLGTGIMKGPIVVNRVRRAWVKVPTPDGDVWDMEVRESLRPESRRVDPWNFFPARGCGENVRKAAYAWERIPGLTRQDLADLAETMDMDGDPIYEVDEIRKCIKEGPKRVDMSFNYERQRFGSGYVDEGQDPTSYDLWEYVGEVLAEDLIPFGIEPEEGPDELMLAKVNAMVTFCNNRVIRVTLNPMKTDGLNYDVFRWSDVDGGPWGVGIPHLIRYGQQTVNAAWRQMQDNAGVSHGPQIVVNRQLINPHNGDWTIHGMKLWTTTNSVADIRSAFALFQVNDNQVGLQNIIEYARRNIDEDASLTILAQGQQGNATNVASGMAMLLDNASVVLKLLARRWDDFITKPHIQRYFAWNMMFNEDDSIKGDFSVKALGATVNVVKALKQQEIAQAFQMRQDPSLKKYINDERLMQQALTIMSLPGVMNTLEEIQQIEQQQSQQPPPTDPRIEVAKLRAQTDQAIAEINAKSEERNLELKAVSMKMDDEREISLRNLELEKIVLDYANQRKISMEQAQADMAMFVLKIRADQSRDNNNRINQIEDRAHEDSRRAQEALK